MTSGIARDNFRYGSKVVAILAGIILLAGWLSSTAALTLLGFFLLLFVLILTVLH